MKASYKYILLIFTSVTMFSCNTDCLEIEQRGVTPTSTYKTADDTQVNQFIAAVYSKIRGNSYLVLMDIGTSFYGVKSDLESMGGDMGKQYEYSETSASNRYKYIWSYYYMLAYWCNMIVENLPDNNVASPNVKNQVVAEARAIRAIAMMNLVQLFGNPPLADHILDGSEGNTPAATSWSFIEKELSEAAEGLPTKSSVNGQAAIGGRLTKEAAYAYLGKAYLWQKKYNEAAQTLHNKVISTNKYALISDFDQLNSSASDFCSEYMWEFDYNEASGYELSQEGLMDVVYFGIQCGTGGLKMPNKFRQTLCFGFGGTTSASFGEFMTSHESLGSSKSSRYNGSIASYEDMLSNYSYSGDKGIDQYVSDCQGYFRVKEECLASDVTGNLSNWAYEYSKKNICYMRYAEVLLNYAEAVAMGGTAGATTGIEALNIVRRRAGLSDAPTLDMNNSQYGVKAERRAELFYEGVRFIDLVRWGDAATVLADCGKQTYMFMGYYDGNNSIAQDPTQWNVVATQTVGKGFKSGKNELFPIPLTDINTSTTLVQNTGW